MEESFVRSAALLGEEALGRLRSARALVVGVGGVGSWCAEALVRTGLGSITIVDDDVVAVSNVNRQAPAMQATFGRKKVEVMAERLRAISPACEVLAQDVRFTSFDGVGNYDVVIDAIDSVADKAELILGATGRDMPLVSSMGAALRTDPTAVRVTRFEKVTGDGLAKALRNRFRRLGRFPERRFSAVWSAEPPIACKTRGSLMTVTATFGMCLAAEAIKILTAKGEL